MQRDSIANTFFVAISLCLVCALVVSGAAVGLRPWQEANKELDRKKNVLMAAGLVDSSAGREEVEEKYKRVQGIVVNLEEGQIEPDADPEAVDPIKEAKSGDVNKRIVLGKDDPASIKTRENESVIYKVTDEQGNVTQYVFPIRGYGLWSTLYGYLALQPDLETISGITYYQHAETPGLGGEVDNPAWKAQWDGKKLYNQDEQVVLEVVKGKATSDTEVDGLSGASITSKGVQNMIHFWFGDRGFKSVIDQLKSKT